ncbi:MAG: hypothetical protein Q7K65_00305 [Candidatus Buchananbacteria bacterium]|nr:hypothetical protein [Candidatus Buchananbacteria bacterium]
MGTLALTAAEATAGSGAAIESAIACNGKALAEALAIECIPVPITGTANGVTFDCSQAMKTAVQSAINASQCQNVVVTENNQIHIAADSLREVEKQTWRDVLAGAWKSMLSAFSKQLAYDTASWIASGGKGQKPLFITEGIGAYLKNTADNAAGTFIDEIDKEFGVNLCRPNFNVELMIKTSLRGDRIKKPTCNFTGMVKNWRSAITDANFNVEYSNYLNASENDIGIYLKTSSSLMDKVKEKTGVSALEASINQGFKDLKTLTGWVLTPGTMVKNQHEVAQERAGKEDSTFTGTVWDFIQTFLDTLVGQLLENLKTGYFKSGSSDGNKGFNLPNLSRFASLLNPESSPYVEGSIGAKERFLNLIESNLAIGGPYDILNKLTNCTEANKINPGPTDCVIDPILSQAIREKKLVKDLPASILNRQFVPPIDNVNPQESFSLRNIVILRKYRIVPVGWEIAARYISQSKQEQQNYTLGDLLKEFNHASSTFQNLIDPQWVLKAPELFCRREGYGDQNTRASSQDGSVVRNQYCADEQQCLTEDSDGNCTAYGYCTEERKIWNLNSTNCQPRFNTCQTFQSKNGTTGSYLANTLDYSDCSSQSAGCRWYSTLYNIKDNTWLNSESEKTLKTCNTLVGCTVSGLEVEQWKQTAYSANAGIVMDKVCATDGGCDFSGESCTVPFDGVRCSLDKCLNSIDILTPFNNSFELIGNASWDARFWQESYQNDTNRQFRSDISKRTGSYSLESVSFNNTTPLSTTLSVNSGVEANKNYKLSFYLRGNISLGSFDVKVFSSSLEVGSQTIGLLSDNWQEYSVNFSTQNIQAGDSIEIRVITNAGTTGTVFFDDFSLKEALGSCTTGDVWLNIGSQDNTDSEIYFDRDAQACSSSAVGCSQFIRVKSDLGSNLIVDGSFEDYYSDLNHWIGEPGASGNHGSCEIFVVNSGADGDKSIGLRSDFDSNSQHCAYFSATASLSPLTLINGNKYILSARVYIQKIGSYFVSLNDDASITTEPNTFAEADLYKWTTVSTSFVWNSPDEVVSPRLFINQGSSGLKEAYFDAVKLEAVSAGINIPTSYTSYNPSQRPASQLTYLKKAPDYYDCYLTSAGNWPTNLTELQQVIFGRNPACANYSSVCIKSEMNCELYTPVNGDPAVPGTITSADVCPSECAGYQVYKQEPTSFVSAKYKQFIAKDPIQYCSAAAAGCDEFTNLDEVARGGEGLEYYTQFRTCQKPDAYGDEVTYYTWEGSDTTGYQLKVFTLKGSNDTSGVGTPPCTNLSYPNNLNGDNVCGDPVPSDDPNTNDAACLSSDLNSNPDCREFYDVSGNIHYRLLSRVIYVSSDCHPYRRTQTQNDEAEAAQDCRNNQGYYNQFGECIYMAIPGQGQTCSANLKGCREYTGNKGSSFRNIFLSDFESGAMDWQGGTIASEATHPGGNSLTNSLNSSRQFSKTVLIKKDKSYAISFWAKGNAGFDLDSIRFSQAPPEGSFIVGHPDVVTAGDLPIPITNEWNRYDLGPVQVSWGSGTGYFEQNIEINIPSGQVIYIDNILLKELPQSVYAIENSWFTPFVCDNIISQPYGAGDALNPERSNPGKMIGCQEYRDRSNKNWFLKSFENLCRRDAVGCEQLIDTYNSDSYYGATYNSGDPSQVTVPSDNFVYIVNDSKYNCKSEDKGCLAYGLPKINNQDEVVGYADSYLKNQPDRYATDLCQASALWCQEFVGSRNVSYFKDPRDRVCEYRTDLGQAQAQWYKKGTTEPCDVTYLQTIGTGSPENKVQPVGWFNSYRMPSEDAWPTPGGTTASYQNWVGLCPAEQSSCTEYIDPITEVYKNEILNVDLSQDADGNDIPDHWDGNGTGLSQNINLLSHTLYSFSVDESATTKAKIEIASSTPCTGLMVSPDDSMNITGGNIGSPKSASGRFYIIYNSHTTCLVKLVIPAPQAVNNLRLVQSGVYYALSAKVDYTGCNGLIDYNSGCVLFNDRGSINYSAKSVSDRNVNYLTFDAGASYKEQMDKPNQDPTTPISATPPAKGDANVILKVQPDRTCYNWLYCTTYEKDDPNSVDPIYGNNDRCLDLGLCASVDEKGVCNNFILKSGEITDENYSEKDFYKTGYASVGKNFPGGINVAGYFPYYLMTQFGNAGSITNGNFESVVTNSTEPLGWSPSESTGDDSESYKSEAVGWHDYKFSVAKDTKSSPDGSRHLILNSFYEALSEEIDVFGGDPYILSGWINSSGLNYPDGNEVIQSQIQYREHTEGGSWGDWKYPTELSLVSGLSWTKRMFEFNPSLNTDKIRIKLKNHVNIGGCNDNNQLTECALGGTALFDDISLKPILKVSNDLSTPNDLTDNYLTRSCRIYPAEDALSCRYLEGNNLFYGSYGYCLLVDPNNSKQCLQWWPVDQLQGEILNEVGGYNDRLPLDYCVEKKRFNVDFSKSGVALSLSSDAQEVVSGFSDINTGQQMNFSPMNIKDDYRSLFRFPYVDRIKLKVTGFGFQHDVGFVVMIPVNKTLTYDTDKREWKGWAAIPFCVGLGGEGGFLICLPIPIPYEIATGNIGGIIEQLTQLLQSQGDLGVYFGPLMGLKIIDDTQAGGITGGATDPIPDLDGDILGASWFVRSTAEADAVYIRMTIKGDFDINYCDSLVRVVTSSGTNKAYANRVTPGSGFINNDAEARNKAEGETTGKYYYYDPFDFNKFLDNIDFTYNGSDAAEVPGSGVFIEFLQGLLGQLGGWFGGGSGGDVSALDASTYQSSDYQPFGAIVSPSGSPNPVNWSSRAGIFNTPLLYEPPRLGGFAPPYQARMGEIHSQDGLQQLFAQSYGAWKWRWNKCEGDNRAANGDCLDGPVADRGGVYKEDPSREDYLSIPSGECNGGATGDKREESSVQPCYVKPKVTSKIINNSIDPTIYNGVGLAKLAFTTLIDPDQLPLTAYVIDWKDGEKSKVSGVSLRNRTNPENPFLLYHLYDFNKVSSIPDTDCNNDSCTVEVEITVYDNWNKSNDPVTVSLTINKNQ